jgi:YVTN family beta-propeller protein
MILLLQATNASPRTDLVPINHTILIPKIEGIEFNPINNNMYVSGGNRTDPENFFSPCCIYIIGPTNQVIDNITVQRPQDLEFNPSNNYMYAASGPGGTVSIINGTTNEVTDTIRVGDDPRFLTLKFNPANNSMYVSDFLAKTISVLDSETTRVIDNISLGFGAEDLVFNPANKNFYIPNPSEDSVLVIDGTTNRVIDNITVGDHPFIPMFNPANNNIYIPNIGSNIVSVIDTSNRVIDNITVPVPAFLEFNAANNNTYISSSRSNVISVIDSANKFIQNVTLFGQMSLGIFTTPKLQFNPADNKMYITNPIQSCIVEHSSTADTVAGSFECADTVAVVDSTNNTVLANVFTGEVGTMKFNPANQNLYGRGGAFINEGSNILVIAES